MINPDGDYSSGTPRPKRVLRCEGPGTMKLSRLSTDTTTSAPTRRPIAHNVSLRGPQSPDGYKPEAQATQHRFNYFWRLENYTPERGLLFLHEGG